MLANLIDINKYYNGRQILKNVSLSIDERDRIGIVGVNGCGKTTLLRILTGKELPDRTTERDGIVSLSAKTSVGYLEQMSGLDGSNTVIDEMKNVFSELDTTRQRRLYEKMSAYQTIITGTSFKFKPASGYDVIKIKDGRVINKYKRG